MTRQLVYEYLNASRIAVPGTALSALGVMTPWAFSLSLLQGPIDEVHT